MKSGEEDSALVELAQIKRELIALKRTSERAEYEQICESYASRLQAMGVVHKQRKVERDQRRDYLCNRLTGDALESALEQLKYESQRDSAERRDLKWERSRVLEPFERSLAKSEQRVRSLKAKYAQLSHERQMQMQVAYFTELADREVESLRVLYEDADLVVVDKPAGLLSVPGRRLNLQDSVLGRLRYHMGESMFLREVHRLDRDTSGVMAIAKTTKSHAALSKQFAQRRVRKVYVAILSRPIGIQRGVIDLPLLPDLENRPCQVVNLERGKPSQTVFRCLEQGEQPRVEFVPRTGRTHQLRLHAAQGLNAPIFGDSLYGVRKENGMAERLFLHATVLEVVHPVMGKVLRLESSVPF